jgi:putative nucleotidyltransferase with HDIG domain
MKKITDIYRHYSIMPNLQVHQLRVASVAKQICESLTIAKDTELIISACLLHDMGNIIKFKLEYFPEFLEPEGLEHWKNIQEDYFKRYGTDENHATVEIAKELGLSEEQVSFIADLVAHIDKNDPRSMDLDIASSICKYADMRVSPKKVMSLRERLEEWQKRDNRVTQEYMEMTYTIFREVEKKIFAHATIQPEDITDESIQNTIEELKDFSI